MKSWDSSQMQIVGNWFWAIQRSGGFLSNHRFSAGDCDPTTVGLPCALLVSGAAYCRSSLNALAFTGREQLLRFRPVFHWELVANNLCDNMHTVQDLCICFFCPQVVYTYSNHTYLYMYTHICTNTWLNMCIHSCISAKWASSSLGISEYQQKCVVWTKKLVPIKAISDVSRRTV